MAEALGRDPQDLARELKAWPSEQRVSSVLHPIKRARSGKGWTCDQLAQRAGVSVSSLWYWEEGSLPRPQGLHKLAEALGREWPDLLEELVSWQSAHSQS